MNFERTLFDQTTSSHQIRIFYQSIIGISLALSHSDPIKWFPLYIEKKKKYPKGAHQQVIKRL